MTATPTVTPTPAAPVIDAVSASSITRSSATITWTTANQPSTTQVEFAPLGGAFVFAPVDATLVSSHRQVLSGLQPGVTYQYRVRSVSAGGALSISPDNAFVTAALGSGPDVGGVSVRRVTSTTASIGWVTASGIVAQLEYGLTANYGAFTSLAAFGVPSQEMLLTGLQPGSEYHFRIKSWDATGFLSASDDYSFATARAGVATLLGENTVLAERVTLPAGQAAAFQYVAAQSGLASVVRLYLDSASTVPVVRVGLYSDLNGAPTAILSQGSTSGLKVGWTNVSIPPVSLVQGTNYWIAVLAPVGSGSLSLREAGAAGRTSPLLSRQTALAAFPVTWTPTADSLAMAALFGQFPGNAPPLSAYVQQLPPSVTVLGPTDGSIVTGKVQLTAVADDDVPIARVQFSVDGVPVGPAVFVAPYVYEWDTSAASTRQPHMISSIATDLMGRSATSASVTVQVDNGPTISGVAVARGLTMTSVRVNWNTDVLADGQVEFGRTTAYGLSTPVDPRPEWRHEAQVTGLAPATTYHYRVRSRDANGVVATSADATFATAEP